MTAHPANAVRDALAHDMSEAQLLAHVRDAAKKLGWLMAHFNDSRREVKPGVHVGDTDATGFPDCVLVRGNRIIFAELKTEKGKVSGEQMQWLSNLTVARGEKQLVEIWRPVDWLSGRIEKALR